MVTDQNELQILNARLKMINSGPVVRPPTTMDFELATIPEDKYGIPPFTVAGSTSTSKISDIA